MAKFESTGATRALMTGLALAFQHRLCSGALSSVAWNAWFDSLGVMKKVPFRVLLIFYPEVNLSLKMNSKIATFSVHIVLVIMLPAILVISNNYYLHVLNMILVLLSFVSEIVTYAITMK